MDSSVGNFGSVKPQQQRNLITCKAYEAEQPNIEASIIAEVDKKAKIGIYFATWWALNVVFNIYNKKVLNAFPWHEDN